MKEMQRTTEARRKVECEGCQRVVPLFQAIVPEAFDEDPMYFCGLDCYEQWRWRVDTEEMHPRHHAAEMA
jgi:hypothetical protein